MSLHHTNNHCAQRFLVFRACQEFMHMRKRAPSSNEIAVELYMCPKAAKKEMRALNGATGLAYRLNRQNMREE